MDQNVGQNKINRILILSRLKSKSIINKKLHSNNQRDDSSNNILVRYFFLIFQVFFVAISSAIISRITPWIPQRLYPEMFQCISSEVTKEILQEIALCLSAVILPKHFLAMQPKLPLGTPLASSHDSYNNIYRNAHQSFPGFLEFLLQISVIIYLNIHVRPSSDYSMILTETVEETFQK